MMFLKRDFDVPNAVIKLGKWADAIILYNATDGDNTEDYDVEDAGLRHTTNISICNVFFMDIETDQCVAHASPSRRYEVLNED